MLTVSGELYDADKIEETERNLRGLRYLADAEILPEPQSDGTVDLRVRSRDRFTLRAGADAKYVGGVARYSVNVGESNLFGRGKRLMFGYSQEGEHEVWRGTYHDARVAGSRLGLRLEHAESDTGRESVFALSRPFFSEQTPWALELEARKLQAPVDFYADGQVAAEVPRDLERLYVSAAISNGRRRDTRRLHLDLESTRTAYEAPILHDPGFALAAPASPVICGMLTSS